MKQKDTIDILIELQAQLFNLLEDSPNEVQNLMMAIDNATSDLRDEITELRMHTSAMNTELRSLLHPEEFSAADGI